MLAAASGHAGPHRETTGRSVDEGGLHRRRRRERDVPRPRHARRGDRDRLRPRADLVSRPAGALLPDPRSDDAEPQGNDVGTSYRSAIFYLDEKQRRWPRTRSPTLKHRASGREGRHRRDAGRAVLEAEPSIRTISSGIRTGTPATFHAQIGFSRAEPNRSRARHASAGSPPLRLPDMGCPLLLRASAYEPCRDGSHRRIDFGAVPEEVEAMR